MLLQRGGGGPPVTEALAEVRDVTKHFPLTQPLLATVQRKSKDVIHAVERVSVAIGPGRCVGRSGARSLRPRREPPRATKPHATSARRWRASRDRSARRGARRDETLPPDPAPARDGPAEVEGRDSRGRTRVRCDRARRDSGLDRRVGFWQDDPRLALLPPPPADVGDPAALGS